MMQFSNLRQYAENLYSEHVRPRVSRLLRKRQPFNDNENRRRTTSRGEQIQKLSRNAINKILREGATLSCRTLFEDKTALYKVIKVCEQSLWKQSRVGKKIKEFFEKAKKNNNNAQAFLIKELNLESNFNFGRFR